MMMDSQKFSQVNQVQIDRVRMMHDRFAEGSEFSFNYNTLLVVASILAGMGLVSDSATTVIASMLVSPIMGPVVGIAYGATIRDWNLCKTALKTELLSLFICIVIGAILALCCGPTNLSDDWPTQEMVVRGQLQNFYVALPVAFFSGFGVAVSLLDEQTSSLVGVAISASLLPPAVNAGILWISYGFYEAVLSEQDTDEIWVQNATVILLGHEETVYARDGFRKGGSISLALTIANVALIIVSSMIMFRLKEVRTKSNDNVPAISYYGVLTPFFLNLFLPPEIANREKDILDRLGRGEKDLSKLGLSGHEGW
jgi:uncharacterized hydrophobic protein (TIGR00271 family)